MKEDDIDFVLVWDTSQETATSQESASKRQMFQRNLIKEGLQLSEEPMEGSDMQIIKIRAPTEVLRRYTEILKLRMPMKHISQLLDPSKESPNGSMDIGIFSSPPPPRKSWKTFFTRHIDLDPTLFPPLTSVFSAVYSRDKEYLFDTTGEVSGVDGSGFFTHGIRSLIIDFILRRNHYTEKKGEGDFGVGIEPLLSDGVYCGAYPLHDGDVKTPGCMRNTLDREWGSLAKSFKYQPLDAINSYFGLKVVVYFAWLGFYTQMLIPVAFLGVLAFLYGIFTLPGNPITNDICGGIIQDPMCPHCDQFCGYWNISDTCAYSQITHLFDNDATVIFSILSSFWTIIFLERWKRYEAEIKSRWDLSTDGENDDSPRPNYLARLRQAEKRMPATPQGPRQTEPSLDFWRTKLPNMLISLSSILFLIFMALAAVMSVILYRLAFKFILLSRWAPTDPSVHGWGLMLANMTAVCLNLVFIVFFNWLYSFLAEYLTELELHRTQADFDDSLTLKMYLLQFINYYASIFYIAFFKGRFAGTPHAYKHIFGYRNEECGSGGCMAELCIQLAIVMVGKQALNAVFEMGKPFAVRWIKTHCHKQGSNEVKVDALHTQAAKDMTLTSWNTLSLFPEYLEMVLQFGFSTIFVSAFPLAPFFALVNNVFEIRLDAHKLLKYYQRPVGTQVVSIGIWFDILNSITKLAVLSNAFIIAFTSNFIPKLIYRMEFGSLDGFLENTLATFNTSLFAEESRPRVEEHHITHADTCRYESFNKGHEGEHRGTTFFWEVWVARLLFIVIYQNGIFFGVMIIQWMIPDVPPHVQEKIRQENDLINKVVIRKERSRSRGAMGEKEVVVENCESTKAHHVMDSDEEERQEIQRMDDSRKKSLSRANALSMSFPDSLENIA